MKASVSAKRWNVVKASMLAVLLVSLPLDQGAAERAAETPAGQRSEFTVKTAVSTDQPGAATALPLKLALELALTQNLGIQVEKISIPISEKAIIERYARFDPVLFGEVMNQRREEQTSWLLSGAPLYKENGQAGKVGARKLFAIGLEAESYLESSRGRNNSEFEGLEPKYQSILVLSLRQPLLQDLGPQVNTTEVTLAEKERDLREQSFRNQVIATLDRTEQTYHDLSGAIETLKLREESLALAEKLLSDNRRRFAAGLTHVGEVQEAETAVAARQEQVIAARQVVSDLTNAIKNLLQIRPDSPLHAAQFLTEGLPTAAEAVPNYEQSFSQALANRPDYFEKKIAVESQDILLEYRKNQLLPRLDLVGTFGVNGLSGRTTPLTFQGVTSMNPFGGSYGDSWERMADADGYQWLVGLTVDIPLGNRADRSRYEQVKLSKEQSILDLKNLEDRIDLEIKVALENIGSSRKRIEVAERTVALADKSLGQEEERMKQGLSDTFRVLIFQGALIEAKVRKTQALVDYHKALAMLYRATGTNLQRREIYVNGTHGTPVVQQPG